MGHAAGPFERRDGVDPGDHAVGEHAQQPGVIVDVGGSGEGGEQGTEPIDGEDDRPPRRRRVGLPAGQLGGEKAHEPYPSLGVVEADDRAAVGQLGDRGEQLVSAGIDDVAMRLGSGGDDERAQRGRRARAEGTDQGEVAVLALPAQGNLPLRCRVVDQTDGTRFEARDREQRR